MDLFKRHEQFEMDVLSKLQSGRILEKLVFGGGTMLRLCHELNRYSVDLDFYLKKPSDEKTIGNVIHKHLEQFYIIRDFHKKRHTILVEVSSPQYPRKLKIEINTRKQYIDVTQSIVWSPHSNHQVVVTAIILPKMMELKINALLDRKEIRDAYDIEFLIRRGINIDVLPEQIGQLKKVISGFKPIDFKVKLGSILPAEIRDYYNEAGFSFLQGHLNKLEN